MAPELEKWGKAISDTISRGVGVNSSKFHTLQNLAEEALAFNDFEKLAKLTSQLNQIKRLDEQVSSLGGEMTDIFKAYGVKDVDVEFPDAEEKQPLDLVESEEAGDFEQSIYTSRHTSSTQIRELIKKDDEGKFVHQSLTTIAKIILRTEERENNESLIKARSYIGSTRCMVANKIIHACKKTVDERGVEIKTMKGFFEVNKIDSLKNKDWKAVYRYVVRNYGNLSPEEFVNKVLLREMRVKKSTAGFGKVGGEEMLPTPASGTVDSFESKGIEQILFGKFSRPEVISQISAEVLGGVDVWSMTKSTGLIPKNCDDPQKLLEESCEKAFNDRNNERVGDVERRKLEACIARVIRTGQVSSTIQEPLHSRSKQMTMLSLKLLSMIGEQCGGDCAKQDKLLNILFPTKKVIADADGIVQKMM